MHIHSFKKIKCIFTSAAAHSAYSTSLKNTAAALGDFSHGEVANPQSTTTGIGTAAGDTYILVPPQKPFDIPLPPPPLAYTHLG